MARVPKWFKAHSEQSIATPGATVPPVNRPVSPRVLTSALMAIGPVLPTSDASSANESRTSISESQTPLSPISAAAYVGSRIYNDLIELGRPPSPAISAPGEHDYHKRLQGLGIRDSIAPTPIECPSTPIMDGFPVHNFSAPATPRLALLNRWSAAQRLQSPSASEPAHMLYTRSFGSMGAVGLSSPPMSPVSVVSGINPLVVILEENLALMNVPNGTGNNIPGKSCLIKLYKMPHDGLTAAVRQQPGHNYVLNGEIASFTTMSRVNSLGIKTFRQNSSVEDILPTTMTLQDTADADVDYVFSIGCIDGERVLAIGNLSGEAGLAAFTCFYWHLTAIDTFFPGFHKEMKKQMLNGRGILLIECDGDGIDNTIAILKTGPVNVDRRQFDNFHCETAHKYREQKERERGRAFPLKSRSYLSTSEYEWTTTWVCTRR